MEKIKGFSRSKRWKDSKKSWYKYSRNPLSVAGLVVIVLIIVLATFAPYIVPYPRDAEEFVYNASSANLPPSLNHLFGTDELGRDIFSRVIYGYRYSLLMVIVVLGLTTPVGVILGLVAGYFKGSWIDTLIMRITDIFIAVPILILAMSITSVTTASALNAMLAVSLMWWPWYTRLVYGITSSLRNESFVHAAQLAGAKTRTIIFGEILPNCLSTILTKMTLDAGFVILVGASLSFIGLGAQPPTPDLGTMVSDGAKFLPELWWKCVFPSLAIVAVIFGFNLLGDGIRDLFATEEL